MFLLEIKEAIWRGAPVVLIFEYHRMEEELCYTCTFFLLGKWELDGHI